MLVFVWLPDIRRAYVRFDYTHAGPTLCYGSFIFSNGSFLGPWGDRSTDFHSSNRFECTPGEHVETGFYRR